MPPTDAIGGLLAAVAQDRRGRVTEMLASEPGLVNAEGPHPLWGGRPRPLHVAAEWGREAVVRDLLDAGADPNADSSSYGGWSPLLIATRWGREGIVQLLLDRGARWDPWSAAAVGEVEHLREFLRADPGLVQAHGPNGATPLHFAGTLAVARLLVEAGATLTSLDQYGGTPLRWRPIPAARRARSDAISWGWGPKTTCFSGVRWEIRTASDACSMPVRRCSPRATST